MRKFTLRIFMLLCLMASFTAIVQAQTFGIGSSYFQNFDTMRVLDVATLPQGWKADAITTPYTVGSYSAAGTTTTYAAGADMASNNSNGGIYNFGAGTSTIGNGDRAVGGMNTSNNPTSINIYAGLTTSTAISSFTVSYDVEKYRNGKNNDGAGVQLYYSTNGTTWTAVPAGLTVFAADADNSGFNPAPGSTRHVDASFSVNVASGSPIYFAWNISVAPNAVGGNASNSPALGIDNVTISAASGGPGGLYFRSHASGNWNSGATWETSTDGNTYTYDPANVSTPAYSSARTITIQSGHTVTVGTDETADELYVNGTLSISGTLSIYDGQGFDITVTGGTVSGTGTLIMKSYDGLSSDVGTATMGTSSGTVTVKAIVERYLSAAFNRSAWRLLTAPLTNTFGGVADNSIWANWQNSGVYSPGIGTAVTGPTYVTAAGGVPGAPVSDVNGLDYSTPGYSIRNYDPATNSYPNNLGVSNTRTTPLYSVKNNSFLVFINGDRQAYSPYTSGSQASVNKTTLRPAGGLQVGDVTFVPNATPDLMTLVGNPYASHIDLDLFRQANTDYIKSTYYYVDPYLTGWYGTGGYVTVSYDANGNELITPQSGGTTTSPVYETRYLQSGQAMFVQTKTAPVGPAVVTFTENQKAPTTVNYIMRTQRGSVDNIRVNLNVLLPGGSVLVDGIVAAFDNNYAAAVDDYDAVKVYNAGESISFMRNGSALSIERRPDLTSSDVLNLNLTSLKSNVSYQFEIKPSLNGAGLNAFLVDNYLKTTTPVDLSKTTTVNFTVNSDAASTGANRFYISFAKPVVTLVGKDGLSIFPNPVTNGIVNLQMNNMPAGIYNVRVFNGVGQVVATKQINHAAGNSTETILLGKGSVKGVYQLEVVKPDNTKFATKVMAN